MLIGSRFAAIILGTALAAPFPLLAQEDAVGTGGSSGITPQAVEGDYRVIQTLEEAPCFLLELASVDPDEVRGNSSGTIQAIAARRGLVVHLQALNVFDGPVEVAVAEGGGMSYQGPVRIRVGPLSDAVPGRLMGSFEVGQDATPTFSAKFQVGNELCTFRGSLVGVRTGLPRTLPDPVPPPTEPPAPTKPVAGSGPVPALPGPSVPPQFAGLVGQEVSFQASNYPERFIRHRFSLGVSEPVTDALARDDSTFRIMPGLAGKCVSLESHNYPGQFLRHHGWRIRLAPREDNDLFRNDATFCMVPGLASSAGVTFESVNHPRHYLRHRNNELWVDRFDDSDLFRRDATFNITHPGGAMLVR